ncbi:P18 [Betabaculovirus altermyunipunctae]|uniref:P18 n=1 Tax=Betabaculovirus altermyunipunctae TaxID=3051996 RepID=A0A1S5YDZ9_9BBAC|nr:P18 [Betabaculovirus altermyunipunctae]AQQ80361.1 P18 [Betabaculovirus altermyunipunctae]
MNRVLNLYTFKPTNVSNDSVDDEVEFMMQGLLECLDSDTADKHACFLELKREQALLMQKVTNDFKNHLQGTYFRNHVLLDALVLYRKYVTEFGDSSAFGQECVSLCVDIVYSVYELFGCASDIVVNVKQGTNTDDVVYLLLKGLSSDNIVSIEKVTAF